jgi:hypothetical protein
MIKLPVRPVLMSLAAALLAGCSQMPTIGPSRKEVAEVADRKVGQAIQIVDVDDGIARRLQSQRKQRLFSDSLGSAVNPAFGIGTGDAIEINAFRELHLLGVDLEDGATTGEVGRKSPSSSEARASVGTRSGRASTISEQSAAVRSARRRSLPSVVMGSGAQSKCHPLQIFHRTR